MATKGVSKTLYINKIILERLEELAKSELRSVSFSLNQILEEKLGAPGEACDV